jgi:L-rhamnose mutarotase
MQPGYFETDDLVTAQRATEATEVNARRQAEMAGFFVGTDGAPPDRVFVLLPEVFQLE